MDVILIAAVTVDGFIARHAHEPITWSKDLSLFKQQTMNHAVIMGSNTFNLLPKDLEGRSVHVLHRQDNPHEILSRLNDEKCFIAGGGKTNARFAPYLTHLYLTQHPFAFGSGVPLFDGLEKEVTLEFKTRIPVSPEEGIYQVQYRVKREIDHNV